jgi:AcrR family transcriptional regulator
VIRTLYRHVVHRSVRPYGVQYCGTLYNVAVTSVWARDESKRRTTLSREQIVRAAIALADAEGAGAVSIRRVASELGARTMSLYTYIERKEDLLDLMVDEVAAAVLVPGPLPADWREATIAIARRERAAVRQHPWMIDLVARRSTVGHGGPNGLRHLEQSLAALAGLDVAPEWKWRLVIAVSDYTSGFVQREAREAPVGDEVRTYLERLVATGEFPNLGPMLTGDPPAVEDNNFEQGLRWLLDGIAADLA